MRKPKVFLVTILLGALLAVAVADDNWLLAAAFGAALVAALWLFVHVYPRDAAPPADRRHEATVRRKSGLKPY
ncbi:MAG: hypothetical protein ACTHLR_13945 [Rhizomicrobium sp.]